VLGPITVEGPYGCFDFEDAQPHQIWVGAGIGITPFIARMKQRAAAPDAKKTLDIRSWSSSSRQLQLATQARASSQRHQHVQTELVPFSAHQIGHAGLADAQDLGRFNLRPVALFHSQAQLRHQVRAHRQHGSLLRRKTKVGKYVAA
jgi:predicted ferric reductase